MSTTITTGRMGPVAWTRLKSRRPKAVVFAPPLIGGSAGTMLRQLRWMASQGGDVFSFDYSGHGRSGGAFTLNTSLQDTRTMARAAASAAAEDRLPVYGFGACYGAIPLVFSAAMETPMSRMILLNPIPGISVRPALAAFRRWRVSARGNGRGLSRYIDTLFPFTEKGPNGFGVLARRRTRLMRTLHEALHFTPLDSLRLDGTRLLCLYTTGDIVRQAAGYGNDRVFRRCISAFCPGAHFHAIEGDHYLARPDARRQIRDAMKRFLLSDDGQRGAHA